jgi:hypothetical protein
VEPRKLLIVLEKGIILMMNLLFDQAELDVADALFTVVKCDSPVLPSSVIIYHFKHPLLACPLSPKTNRPWNFSRAFLFVAGLAQFSWTGWSRV